MRCSKATHTFGLYLVNLDDLPPQVVMNALSMDDAATLIGKMEQKCYDGSNVSDEVVFHESKLALVKSLRETADRLERMTGEESM